MSLYAIRLPDGRLDHMTVRSTKFDAWIEAKERWNVQHVTVKELEDRGYKAIHVRVIETKGKP